MAEPDPTRRRILVIDDEASLRHMLEIILDRAGYDVVTAADGEAGLATLEADPGLSIVLCDVRMPRLDGLGFLDRLGDRKRWVHTIVMSAYGSMELALEAMKRGAYDYISKPFKPDEILLVLKKVEERERLARENRRLRAAVREQGDLEGFLGRSPVVTELVWAVRKVAAYPTTVLLTGESGTGKELLARGLHRLSGRPEEAFVAVNCGAIPENLLESELFGHERGAFTGAHRSREGLFEQAHRGTLLLDELGELPLGLQVKLLRVLEERTVRRVGGSKDIPVDVRVVAATSRDLDAEVEEGAFRKDLLYRINVVHLKVPSLRERPGDIPLLADHFVRVHAEKLGRAVTGVETAALRLLVGYRWPGNVRQLENVLERAVLLCDGDVVTAADLSVDVRSSADSVGPATLDEVLSFKDRLPALEADLIAKALARTEGNRTQAARILEISYKALLYKIRDYGLGRGAS
jgi:two-component system, NtrC family, response regulator AtoC